VRRSLVVLIILATVLALSIGTALAENKPADKGVGKGQEQQGASKTTAAQGQQRIRSARPRARLLTITPPMASKET
jgi:hypothetical protein